MEQAELAEISRSFRSAMGESAGQFRQAARENGANLEKIVKDLSRSFKAQSNQIAELSNSLDETAHETQLTVDRIDRLNSAVQESLSVQSSMLNELKNITIGMRSLSGSINTLDNNLQTSLITGGANSLLGGVTTKLGLVQTAIVSAIAGIVIGGGAKTAYDYMTGGGGETTGGGETKPTVGSAEGREGYKQIYEAAKKAGDKFPEVTASQWALESAWGKKESGANNVFGQKAKAGEPGTMRWTTENIGGQNVRVQAKFKDYSSVDEAVAEHVKKWSSRYAGASSAEEAAQILKNSGYATDPQYVSKVMSIAKGQSDVVKSSVTPVAQPSVTPGATSPQQTTEAASANAPRAEPISGEHGHGPISGAMGHGELSADKAKQFLQARQGGGQGFVGVNAEKLDSNFAVKMAEAIQQAEAATGVRAVITEGYRPPEVQAQYYANYVQQPIPWEGKMYYPQKQGGIAARPGHSRHQKGLAVDLSDNAARDWLISNASRLGLGRVPNDAPHFQGSGGGEDTSVGATPMSTSGAQVTPSSGSSSATSPLNPAPSLTQTQTPTQATPVEQPPVSPRVAAPMTVPDMGAMMGMMGGMMPGGMGGMVGMLAPMLMSAVSALPTPTVAQPLQNVPNQDPIAELLSSLSGSAMNSQIVSEAAVQKQAQQEESMTQLTQEQETRNAPPISSENLSFNNPAPGYNYNMPWDTGWPDWLDALGGVNYSEMKSIKTSFR